MLSAHVKMLFFFDEMDFVSILFEFTKLCLLSLIVVIM